MRIKNVVEDVGEAIAQVDFKKYGLVVDELDLTVTTTSVMQGGIKVDLDVVEIDASVQGKEVQTITLSLIQQTATPKVLPDDLLDGLIDGVRNAAEGLRQAAQSLPDYMMKSATLELTFTIDASGKFAVGISVGGGRTWEQSLKITLKRA